MIAHIDPISAVLTLPSGQPLTSLRAKLGDTTHAVLLLPEGVPQSLIPLSASFAARLVLGDNRPIVVYTESLKYQVLNAGDKVLAGEIDYGTAELAHALALHDSVLLDAEVMLHFADGRTLRSPSIRLTVERGIISPDSQLPSVGEPDVASKAYVDSVFSGVVSGILPAFEAGEITELPAGSKPQMTLVLDPLTKAYKLNLFLPLTSAISGELTPHKHSISGLIGQGAVAEGWSGLPVTDVSSAGYPLELKLRAEDVPAPVLSDHAHAFCIQDATTSYRSGVSSIQRDPDESSPHDWGKSLDLSDKLESMGVGDHTHAYSVNSVAGVTGQVVQRDEVTVLIPMETADHCHALMVNGQMTNTGRVTTLYQEDTDIRTDAVSHQHALTLNGVECYTDGTSHPGSDLPSHHTIPLG